MRILTEELAEDFFFVHEGLVYGALKKCGINRLHQNYDDFVQIGLWTLVRVYEQFPDDLTQEEYYYQFTGFAFQKIRWAIIDEIRKDQLKKEREQVVAEFFEEDVGCTSESNEDWLVWQLLPSMLNCLAPAEQNYLKDTVFNQLSVTEIAKKYEVSRKTVYQWKKRTGIKLAHYKSVLTK